MDRAPGAQVHELPFADGADADGDPRTRRVGLEAPLVRAEPAVDEAGDGDPRRRGRRLLETSAVAKPRQHDRGWNERDPAEHHRRAGAWPPPEPGTDPDAIRLYRGSGAAP